MTTDYSRYLKPTSGKGDEKASGKRTICTYCKGTGLRPKRVIDLLGELKAYKPSSKIDYCWRS